MSGFRAIALRTAAATVVLRPDDFASDWEGRPTENVCVGLRLVSFGTDETARAEAIKRALEMHPKPEDQAGRIESYFDSLVLWIVARCTCNANDINATYFEAAEDTVRTALTTSGVRKIWDAYEQFVIATSSVEQPIADDEIATLASLLSSGAIAKLPSAAATLRARKLLSFVLSEILVAAVPEI